MDSAKKFRGRWLFVPDGGIRSRRSWVSAVRAVIAVQSKDEPGVSGAEIARHLGVNTSSINRALARAEGVEGQ